MNYSWKDIDEKKTRKWIVLERREDLWDTIAWCAENHRMVWLKYETVEDNEIISRKVAPYSYRTRNTKVRGKSTYFYAQDFTPGQDHEIKCFLIDNCLQAKKSMQKFSPKFPIEIKQEIDRLEQKRQQDELEKKKKREKKDIKKNHPVKKKDIMVAPKDKDVEVPVKKPTAKKPMVKPEKPIDRKEPVKPVEKPKKDISKDNDVKVSKPEPKKPVKPPVKEKPKPQKPKDNGENEIVVTDEPEDNVSEKPDTDEIQVTDDDGNVVKESNWIQLH